MRHADANGVVGHAELELNGDRIMLATPNAASTRGRGAHAEHCDQARRWLDNPWAVDGVYVQVARPRRAPRARRRGRGADHAPRARRPVPGSPGLHGRGSRRAPLDVRRAIWDDAARHWRETWAQGWREHDAAAMRGTVRGRRLLSLPPVREPENPRAYVERVLGEEEATPEVWFGEPVTSGDRAAASTGRRSTWRERSGRSRASPSYDSIATGS